MATTINFPGGATGSYGPSWWNNAGYFAQQDSVGFPNSSSGIRVNLDGKYVVKVSGIGVDRLSGPAAVYIVYGGSLYGSGSTILSSTNPSTACSVRVVNTGGTRVEFYRSGNSPSVKLYTSGGGLDYDWGGALSGYWVYYTVPSAPANISTSLSGTTVAVSCGASASDGGEAIDAYAVQRRDSIDGITWSAWGSTNTMTSRAYTYTNLTPGKYHQFRCYSVNAAGNSSAVTSSSIFVSAMTRYSGTAFTAIDMLKKYDGSAWNNITSVKRYDGTTWQSVDLTGIN